jgi:hypothetical protein
MNNTESNNIVPFANTVAPQGEDGEYTYDDYEYYESADAEEDAEIAAQETKEIIISPP